MLHRRSGGNVCRHGAWGSSLLEGWPTYPLLPFRVSRDKGCSACEMLLGVIEEFKSGWTTEAEDRKSVEIEYEPVSLTITLKENGVSIGNFCLICLSPEKDMFPDNYKAQAFSGNPIIPLSLEIMPDSSSVAAMARVKLWLSHCLLNDKTCFMAKKNSTPKRLLSIDSAENHERIYIVEQPERVEYACLSYCWGSDLDGVLTTTSENVTAHYKSIPLDMLPKTIMDAISLCRGIGISYLWVDSLCIIQDDIKDWQQQSPLMLDIYGQSCLTIYAEHPKSCKEGFLGLQKYGCPNWQRLLETPVPEGLGFSGTRFLMRNPRNGGRDHFDEGMNAEEDSLSTRGWGLQERVLPFRRLIFNGREMTWECQCRRICECGHQSDTGTFGKHRYLLSSLKDVIGLTDLSELEPPTRRSMYEIEKDWFSIVENYSRRDLSRAADKLSAISGLANMFINASAILDTSIGKYYAGLWSREDLFLTGLCWKVTGPPKLAAARWRPLDYRAPSWSWASVDREVVFPRKRAKYRSERNIHVSIDEIICEPVLPGDETGPIKAGYADLRGPLAAVELVNLDDGCRNRWWERQHMLHPSDEGYAWSLVRSNNLRSYTAKLDMPIVAPILENDDERSECWIRRTCDLGCCRSGDKTKWRNGSSGDRLKPLEQGVAEYFCLQLFTWEDHISAWFSHYEGIEPETWFLVLKRKKDTTGCFERIGLGYCCAREDYDEDILWTRCQSKPNSFPSFRCPLFEGSRVENVRIV
ncbi:HET-domain-containing protein [Thozetella sp. PMI_491]|nr:HET-domain-containing protein [Thozetella sp. PMI_491]